MCLSLRDGSWLSRICECWPEGVQGGAALFPVFEWRNYRPLIDWKKEFPTAALQQVKGRWCAHLGWVHRVLLHIS